MRLLIVGGDAAGMSAASQARRSAPEAEVIVLEETADVSYGACGLPYKLEPGARVEELQAVSAESFRRERGIDLRLGHRAERVLPAERRVEGTSEGGPFALEYDRLIIATGAAVVRPPIPGLAELWGRGAYPLKTLEDGRVLKATLARGVRRVVIIGGGYIGLEASEGLRRAGLEVEIVEALPEILAFLPDEVRGRVRVEARDHGVPIRLGVRVEQIERRGEALWLSTSAGELEADLVLVATGVRPRSELASGAGLALGAARGIAVDEHLFTSAPEILAAGDCADARHALTGKSVWIPLALRANRAGKLAGENALGRRLRAAPPVMGTAVFRFFGLEIARTGLTEAEARSAGLDAVSTTVTVNTRAHYIEGGGKLSVHLVGERGTRRLLGGALVGPESAAHRIDTLVAALSARMTAEELHDLDLGYAPVFGPAWSPLLTAASALGKALR